MYSSELEVHAFGAGIKLVKPEIRTTHHYRVSDLLNLSCSVYFETFDGVLQIVNERNAAFCGFDSAVSALHKHYFDPMPKQIAAVLRMNDEMILKEKKTKIMEETIRDEKSGIQKMLSIKMPWYHHNNQLMGLFGMSMLIGEDAIAESLVEITNMGLLSSSNQASKPTYQLAKQQQACANLLSSGMTNKQIAKVLHLSPRTVETYINHLKIKLCCKNKLELIAKLSR